MSKSLVINLTRFGDLIQTQPLITGLNRRGESVGLVCLENFAQAAGLLRHVDKIIPLPGARILAAMKKSWPEGLRELSGVEREMIDFGPDAVINLTPSLPARLLTRILPQPAIQHGFCLDPLGFGRYSSPWASFLQASTRHRGCSPFNLVDLMTRIGECRPADTTLEIAPVKEQDRTGLRTRFFNTLPQRCTGLVGMQLGASENRRRWPVARFALLGKLLWEHFSLVPVLLGSNKELELGERFMADSGDFPVVNLISRTSLPELAGVLSEMDLLVTNDTGTMHLAAGLGIPLLAIFLATAQPWDTGPYLEGCMCLEPELECHPCTFGQSCKGELCRAAISVDDAFHALSSFLHSGKWPEVLHTRCRAWVTSRDQYGYMGLVSPSGHLASDRVRWILLQRHYYRHFLDNDPIHPPEEPLFPGAAQKSAVLADLERGRDLTHLFIRQGQNLEKMPGRMEKKFLATWQTLSLHWEDSPYFNVLGHHWIAETQEAGHSIPALLKVAQRFLHLYDSWLEHMNGSNGLQNDCSSA
ncbi:MAG: glycosyltransferase family 9 protein [Desulfovibrionales bacterium]